MRGNKMKKNLMVLLILTMTILSFSKVFGVINTPFSIGAGYEDENNYLKLTNKDFSFSYKYTFFDQIRPFLSLNFDFNNPIFNNNLNAGVDLIYEDFDFGIGLWNSFTEDASETGNNKSGFAGANVFFNGGLGNIIFGANLTYRLIDIIRTDEGLNYNFQAFPEDLAQLRGFSGYIGYEIFETKEAMMRFYVNFAGKYSIVPGGFVFYKFDQDYSFNLELYLNAF
jgi:hypothetical protein